jgi:hypothetical protein
MAVSFGCISLGKKMQSNGGKILLKVQSVVRNLPYSNHPICRTGSLSRSGHFTTSINHRFFIFIAALLFALCAFPLPSANAAQVTLAWDPSSGPVAGYNVYYGTSSGNYDYSVDVGNFTSCTISGLQEGETYYFSVSAYDSNFNESELSEELIHTIRIIKSESDKIWIEAEDGDFDSPFTVASSNSASSGEYIWVSEGTGNSSNPTENPGSAEYTFELQESGDYVIWGRIIAPHGGSDSFYISIDSSSYAIWDTDNSNEWVWDRMYYRYETDPKLFYLEKGQHRLSIKYREDGTKIDKILITSDLNYIPN